MGKSWDGPLEKIDNHRFRIPKGYKKGMRVPGIVYADDKLIKNIKQDNALEQVANVAFLPGIIKNSLAMPDIHWGYGASIGGVAAIDMQEGVVAPGVIGYDINCGIRLMRTSLESKDIKSKIKDLAACLYQNIPAGVGSTGKIKISKQEEKNLLRKGSRWAVENGYGDNDDIEHTEERGCMKTADPDVVSDRAYQRGRTQPGTLGSGNHFLEIQVVDTVFDKKVAGQLGIFKGQITVMIHSGSRGFGHQVCSDYLKIMGKAAQKYNINLPDRQLASAPIDSPEGSDYISAMSCAANYAWVNRQCLMHLTRETFEKFFKKSWSSLGMNLIYDVAHNIAKFEAHMIDGKEKEICIHRKGATRAYPPGHKDLPEDYKTIGQPVIIPGDMGRCSYLLIGTKKAEETFFSTCHGAGRVMSRTQAVKQARGRSIATELEKKGIYVMAAKKRTLAEESSEAYKDVNNVVNVVHNAGISKKVCRMKPLAVVKG